MKNTALLLVDIQDSFKIDPTTGDRTVSPPMASTISANCAAFEVTTYCGAIPMSSSTMTAIASAHPPRGGGNSVPLADGRRARIE